MSSTRFSQQPLQIFQDPVTSIDRAPMSSHTSTKKSPLRPIKNAASRRNIVFNPPQSGPTKQSPLKHNSSSPSRAPFSSKLNMVSMPPPGGSSYNTDSMEKKPLMSKFKPNKALFTTFTSTNNEKENYQENFYHIPIAPYNDGAPRFSLEGLYPAPPQKRKLMEAAPIHESRPFKKSKQEDSFEGEDTDCNFLPSPESFPPLLDDGSKPAHSYAQLIGMSILRAPNRRLTLAQIYKWISDTYSFYNALDAGWQNSIRHNLSLNKAFIKQERPKDDPGKGNYWAIQPGMEHQFIKDKNVQKRTGPNEHLSVHSLPPLQPEPIHYKQLVPAPMELPPQQMYSQPEPQLPPQPSSDATIPASDAVVTDPEEEHNEPSSPLIHSSPPMAMMHSSPPIPRQTSKRHDTPPPVPRFPSSSRSRSHRKYASMDDSGYISSLESSALRRSGAFMNSDIDRPRMKRGRAEEEIARLRGSSYDSPSKNRTSFLAPSSSPLRVPRPSKADSHQMLPPLTPAIKLKPPVRQPPSVSPNTNLRLHRDRVRELVGSPLRGMTTLEENDQPWSPAFNLDESNYLFPERFEFDIFADVQEAASLLRYGNGSPEKRSAKRPGLNRSRSANILADISNSRSVTSTPSLKHTPALPSGNLPNVNSPFSGLGLPGGSPTKYLGIMGNGIGDTPIKYSLSQPQIQIHDENSNSVFDIGDDFFGAEFLVDDLENTGAGVEEVSEEGWDIMRGFEKIGAATSQPREVQKQPKSALMGISRPHFGRSSTSRF